MSQICCLFYFEHYFFDYENVEIFFSQFIQSSVYLNLILSLKQQLMAQIELSTKC